MFPAYSQHIKGKNDKPTTQETRKIEYNFLKYT